MVAQTLDENSSNTRLHYKIPYATKKNQTLKREDTFNIHDCSYYLLKTYTYLKMNDIFGGKTNQI